MTFPSTALGVAVDLNLDGWTPITPYAVQQNTITATITRGRQNETTTATPSTCGMRWNNIGGQFDPDNPAGPWYGLLGLNTPTRVSIPASSTYLRIEDDTVSYISAPSSAGLSITGDIEIQLDLQLTSYLPAVLASKDDGVSQRSWSVRLNGDGTISFFWDNSGSVPTLVISTVPLPLGRISLRVTLAVASGTVTFYTSTTPIDSSPAWTQLGATSVTGATSVFASTTAVAVGYNAGITAIGGGFGGPPGRLFGFRLLSGIGGTLKASPDFTTATPGAATLTDAQANIWTLAGTAEFSARSYRFHGECTDLPTEWDVTGHDIWTPVAASGILRRLQAGNSPVMSVMRRGITAYPSGPTVGLGFFTQPQSTVAYWPCEDPQGSTQIAAGIGQNGDGNPVAAMTIAGGPGFQGTAGSPTADSTFACSAQLPQVQGSTWTGTVPPYASFNAPAASTLFLLQIPSGGLAAGHNLLQINLGSPYNVNILLKYLTASGGSLELAYSGGSATTPVTGINGVPLQVEIVNDGSGTATVILVLQNLAANSQTAVSAASAPGAITTVVVNPFGEALGATLLGHLWVSAAYASGGSHPAVPSIGANPLLSLGQAWIGETAAARFARVCGENSIQPRIIGYPNLSVAMGPQQIDTIANILQSCEDADRGIVFEPRQCLGLGYRTSHSMLGQASACTLDYSLGEVSPPLKPANDDLAVRNDVTVSRSGGSSAQKQVTSGPLSILPPAQGGAGDYATSLTVYCETDIQPPDIAGWMVHVGTAALKRYPAVYVDLASKAADMQAVLPSVRDADLGDYATIINGPVPLLPPGAVKQLIWGVSEQIGDFTWRIQWNEVPELPYEVLTLDDPVFGHVDTDGSTLAAGVSSSATTLSVATANASSPLWTTLAADFPFDILIGGEQITVTNITGATSPQSFTVTRSVNGVVKAQLANAPVALFRTPTLALV